MSGSVAAAISGDEAKAAAFWQGIARLKTEWKMEKADLCKFMSGSVAAAICGDEAKAAAFWQGLRLLQLDLSSTAALSGFVTPEIANRLKSNEGQDVLTVLRTMGPKEAKALLSKRPLKAIEQCLLVTPGVRKRKVDEGTVALLRPCSTAKHGGMANGTDVAASSSGNAMAQPHSITPSATKRSASADLTSSKRKK
jgi:hypothetical protein